MLRECKEGPKLKLGGDARCDSPGHMYEVLELLSDGSGEQQDLDDRVDSGTYSSVPLGCCIT